MDCSSFVFSWLQKLFPVRGKSFFDCAFSAAILFQSWRHDRFRFLWGESRNRLLCKVVTSSHTLSNLLPSAAGSGRRPGLLLRKQVSSWQCCGGHVHTSFPFWEPRSGLRGSSLDIRFSLWFQLYREALLIHHFMVLPLCGRFPVVRTPGPPSFFVRALDARKHSTARIQ